MARQQTCLLFTGASNGISKNFKIMVEILGTFKTVGDEEPSAAAAPAVPEVGRQCIHVHFEEATVTAGAF